MLEEPELVGAVHESPADVRCTEVTVRPDGARGCRSAAQFVAMSDALRALS